MAFSESIKEEAFSRSDARCECKRDLCATHYLSRCPTKLNPNNAVFIRKKQMTLGDPDTLHNCEVVCEYCAANAAYDQFAGTVGNSVS